MSYLFDPTFKESDGTFAIFFRKANSDFWTCQLSKKVMENLRFFFARPIPTFELAFLSISLHRLKNIVIIFYWRFLVMIFQKVMSVWKSQSGQFSINYMLYSSIINEAI